MYSNGYNGYDGYEEPHRSSSAPLTKHVNQMYYEIPKFTNPWSSPPEFLKVFGDATVQLGTSVTLDCMLLGNPRPKVTWLFNGKKIQFDDVHMHDTTEKCNLTIPTVRCEHYGEYTILAENEVGRAVCKALVSPPPHSESLYQYRQRDW